MSRILLIEDDSTLRRALRLQLEKAGYEVVESEDGQAGLKAFAEQPFDLVITDLIMPGIEGIETIRALRKASATLKIIAISGGGRGTPQGYLYMAKQIGASHVFAKPFEFSALNAAIVQLLGRDDVPSGET